MERRIRKGHGHSSDTCGLGGKTTPGSFKYQRISSRRSAARSMPPAWAASFSLANSAGSRRTLTLGRPLPGMSAKLGVAVGLDSQRGWIHSEATCSTGRPLSVGAVRLGPTRRPKPRPDMQGGASVMISLVASGDADRVQCPTVTSWVDLADERRAQFRAETVLRVDVACHDPSGVCGDRLLLAEVGTRW